jgi:hypothetical protein
MSDTSIEGAWRKLIGDSHGIGRAGCLPIYDETQEVWRYLRNTHTIYEGAENAADPDKVELLRLNVVSLMERYPKTIPQLEKLGVRVRAVLNRPIKTQEDVANWATSVFNMGPVLPKIPSYVHDTMDLAYDDLVIVVKTGRNPVYVIPAGPRDSGDYSTLNFSRPGLKERYGPRHPYSQTAFATQTAAIKKAAREAALAARRTNRPRGRPRRDGLVPGSAEAKAADEAKAVAEREERAQARARRQRVKKGDKELGAVVIPIKSKSKRKIFRSGPSARAEREARAQA